MSRHGGENVGVNCSRNLRLGPPHRHLFGRSRPTRRMSILPMIAAAIAPPPGCDLVLTTDGVISGVHFFPMTPRWRWGGGGCGARKALRINLSDLAAKGAAPLVSCSRSGCRAGLPADWLKSFARGLREDAEHYGCPLLGGDTDRSPGAITVYIAALGAVPHGGMVRRKGARGRATSWSRPAPSGTRRLGLPCGRTRRQPGGGSSMPPCGSPQLPLSVAAAAHRDCGGAAPPRQRRYGRVGRPCWRPGQAVPRVGRRRRCRDCGCAVVAGGARGGCGGAGADRDHPDRRRRRLEKRRSCSASGLPATEGLRAPNLTRPRCRTSDLPHLRRRRTARRTTSNAAVRRHELLPALPTVPTAVIVTHAAPPGHWARGVTHGFEPVGADPWR